MGAAGAGLATLISRICMPLFTLGYFLSVPSLRRYFLFFAWIAQGWRTTRRLLAVGLPISMQMVLEVSAFALTLIMMGWIGTVPLAAHQVVLSLSNIVYMVVVGISAATTDHGEPPLRCRAITGDARAALASLALGNSLRICSRWPVSSRSAAFCRNSLLRTGRSSGWLLNCF